MSEQAKAVAKEVISRLGKSRSERISIGAIARDKGYSLQTSLTPQNITETKSYQSVMKPFVARLEEERNAALERMKVTRGKAKYRDLSDAIDKLTRNIQLLTGGATEAHLVIVLPPSIASKHGIEATQDTKTIESSESDTASLL